MTTAALQYARQCREQLYEFMDEEAARQLYIQAYDEIYGVKNKFSDGVYQWTNIGQGHSGWRNIYYRI